MKTLCWRRKSVAWALSGALAVAALAFAGHAVIFNVTTLRALPAVLLVACGLIIVTRRRSFRATAGPQVDLD